ncbi:methylation-associated defense system protein kinase MAD6 [Corallococcus carmarthensis]|uniref:methylation-associated defense system protein kinase MAD6 n=1 Tax=Corallococcus carmarthensis TaxID=2316728 RepID=UPI00148C26A1|nr:serine/threonine protein kinase [Corallococcus carmarthensis]NOK18304.1 protein kinase [Corallococcus carmarthensis]
MARVIYTPSGSDGPVGAFESEVLESLRKALPRTWGLAPNFQLKQRGHDALEYDIVLLASHALFVIEAKEWIGRLTGDDQEWLLNHTPKRCPMWTVNHKCKVLKTELGALATQAHVAPVLVVPNGTAIQIGGSWKGSVVNLGDLAAWLQDPRNVPSHRAGEDLTPLFQAMEGALQGKWGARQRQRRRRVGSYEIVETLHVSADEAMYVARRAYIEGDPSRYRVRTWKTKLHGSHEESEQRKAVVRRPTEAVARIGRHPNLLPVLQFDYIDEDHEFFEVTEWSEYGTLHGFLTNAERDRLTIRERLEIAEGVAAALEAVHAAGVVHRNVCPATVLVGFDRKPRLTDFDRAWMEARRTVFADTESRTNRAYLPPELADVSDYDFDTTSDMYSFGVLLYQLLTDELPFDGPETARAAGGCPSKLPSEVRAGVDTSIDELVLELLRTDDFKVRPSAADVLLRLRNVLGMTTGLGRKEPSQSPTPTPTELKVGTVLDGVWRLDEEIGKGTFAKVYRVFNLDHQRTYALKVLVDTENADLALHEFTQVQPHLPTHPNIVRIVWMARLGPPLDHPYIVSEFVKGETLEPYCADERRLAWSDIKSIGIQLLDALDAMHSNGVYHRDIKPANVMLELPAHRPKLIDFNIAAKASESKGKAGTRRYWAPDVTTAGWGAHADLFSLGIVLYELVVHRHPFPHDRPEGGMPYDPRQLAVGVRLSDELAEFLLKAVQPHAAQRFQSAAEMRNALTAVPSMLAPAVPPALAADTFEAIQLDPEEVGRADYNPFVTRMLTLYSQARRTNTGTRGLDEIARLTYVRTGLDEKLAPAITTGRYRLVIVTGNAGDGKTAFLQQVEALFEQNGAAITQLPSKNGSTWTWEGRSYSTNYDGSQDEEDRSNDAVLDAFFKPFEGEEMAGLSGSDVRLIAINEGRLLDFLAHGPRANAYGGLRRFVNDALGGRAAPEGALLVNLNLRAVTAGGANSLVERQLMQLLQPDLWASCDGCSVRKSCPLLHNANTLRDPNSGPTVRERVRRLFEVVHLRRRAHVTMRDLRSALSWLLLRDHGCADVQAVLKRIDQDGPAPVVALYYTEAFADPESGASLPVQTAGPERATDRLVRRLREADVGRVNHPTLDRQLDRNIDGAVPWMTFEARSEVANAQLRIYAAGVPRPSDDVPFPSVVEARRQLAAVLRRLAYFERRDSGWSDMLPYTSVGLLEGVINATEDAARDNACLDLRDRVVEAVSVAEGVRNPLLRRNYLALRVSRVKGAAIRSYRLFPKEEFRIEVSRPAHEDFLEFAPDAVELASVEGPARLRISLDLLEMMELIRHGYRPTSADIQGLFVNLLIFRNELLATTFDRVLLSADDKQFFEVSAEARPEGIRMTLVRHGIEGAKPEETA